MNMIGLLLGILTALSVIASGCNSASMVQISAKNNELKLKSKQPKIEVNIDSIMGTWFGACVRDVERDEYFRTDLIEIAADSIDYKSDFFLDSNCTKKEFQQKFIGSYELNGEKISFKYDGFSYSPQSTAILVAVKTGAFCGLKDWEFEKEKSFSDFKSCGYPDKVESAIERFGENELFIGDRGLILNKKTTELDL